MRGVRWIPPTSWSLLGGRSAYRPCQNQSQRIHPIPCQYSFSSHRLRRSAFRPNLRVCDSIPTYCQAPLYPVRQSRRLPYGQVQHRTDHSLIQPLDPLPPDVFRRSQPPIPLVYRVFHWHRLVGAVVHCLVPQAGYLGDLGSPRKFVRPQRQQLCSLQFLLYHC